MKVCISDTPEQALAAKLTEELTDHNGDALCFLAGGSALAFFKYVTLSDDTKSRTIFCMGDERVSGESAVNNYQQLLTHLEPDHDLTIIDTTATTNEDPIDFANRIEKNILEKISQAQNLKIISIQGIGTDGHTAGIFPLPKAEFSTLYKEDVLYAPVHLESLTIDSRASLTPTWILNNVDIVLGYATGTSKSNILKKLLEADIEISEMPAQILKQHKNSFLFTDIET